MNETKKSRGAMPWVSGGVLILLVLLSLALWKFGKREVSVPEPEPKAWPVATLAVTPRSVADTVILAGRIEPYADVVLAAEKGGRILELVADKGDTVDADRVLMRLDARIWEAALRRAEITYNQAERDFKRWSALKETGAVSDSEYDEVRDAYALAEVARVQAEVHVSQCGLRSSISGIVSARYLDEGEYVNEGEAVFRVVDVDRVKLAVSVPEREIRAVEQGTKLSFTIPMLGEREFTGAVEFVSVQADHNNNVFPAEAVVGNPGHLLKPGMIADVTLVRGIVEDAIVLPLSAVIAEKGSHVVFAVTDDLAERRIVQIKSISGTSAIIESGLSAGDEIVIEGHRALQDGLPVRRIDVQP